MRRPVTTVINDEKCIGCGLCVKVCPSRTITIHDGKAMVTGTTSLSCGHCAAVCPADAIRVTSLDPSVSLFNTFCGDTEWLPHGRYDIVQLVRLMGSRRSCRNYQAIPVPRALLEDLVKIGVTAPSGTNSQLWTFTLLPTREAVLALAKHIATFFRKLNRISENRYLRNFLKCIGQGGLDAYYREYYNSVKEALHEWEQSGIDRLFHGATAAIIVGAKREASCPREDALLATQNILLSAHSMGLGSCLIGFAVEALKRDRFLKRFLGIPQNERVYSVIALGYPDETYQKIAGRKEYVQRFYEV